MKEISRPTPEALAEWWDSSWQGELSPHARTLRRKGHSYLLNCVIATRGETVLQGVETQAMVMFGFDGYLIAPLERAVLFPRAGWRVRLLRWLAHLLRDHHDVINLGERHG